MNIFIVITMTGTVVYLYYARAHFDWLGVREINDMPQNIELIYALPFLFTLAFFDFVAFIMKKRGAYIKHKFILTLNVLTVTAMIVIVSILYYLIRYDLNSSAPGYVAIIIYTPPFLLALLIINVVKFIIDRRRHKRKSSYNTNQ